MWFKPGESVTVRDDLQIGYYGETDVVESMLEYKGQTLKIKDVFYGYGYEVEENIYIWTDGMLCPLTSNHDDGQEYFVDTEELMRVIGCEV